jgi:hypothetical protein
MLTLSISRPLFPAKADYPTPAGRVALYLSRLKPASRRVRQRSRPIGSRPPMDRSIIAARVRPLAGDASAGPLGAPEVGASMQPPRSRWSQISNLRAHSLHRPNAETPTPIATAILRRPGRHLPGQPGPYGAFRFGRDRRTAEALPLAPGPRQARKRSELAWKVNSLANHSKTRAGCCIEIE